jgi:hypothetical protein
MKYENREQWLIKLTRNGEMERQMNVNEVAILGLSLHGIPISSCTYLSLL